MTCKASASNGYFAFPQIDANFLPRDGENWNLEGNLGGVIITDFAGVGTSGYGSPRGTGVQVNAYAKYEGLQAMYNLHGSSGVIANKSKTSNNETLFTLIITALGISTLAGVYYFRKRKTAQLVNSKIKVTELIGGFFT